MLRFQNKKSAVKSFLVTVLIITAGFLVIFMIVPLILSSSNRAYADSICKGSVSFRDMTYTEIKTPVIPVTLGAFGTPALCKTSTLDLPEDKNAKPEEVEKEMADLIASCWDRYGTGYIADVFKGGGKKCQVCYIANLKETSKFKSEIAPVGFLEYLFHTPYKVSSESDSCKGLDDGFCVDSEKEEDCMSKFTGVETLIPEDLEAFKYHLQINPGNSLCKRRGHNSCCYTEYGCWDKGGRCSASDLDKEQYTKYDDEQWDCPPDQKCFVENKNYYSYGQYVQRFGGEGLLIVTTGIKPGETYAVSFASPSDKCGWCSIARKIGAVAGAVGGVVLTFTVVGAPLGATLATVSIATLAATVGGVGGTIAASAFAEGTDNLLNKIWSERDMNTIYFTKLNQVDGEHCNVV